MRLTDHFTLSEFACKDRERTPVPAEHMESVQRLADALEVVRQRVGAPLRLNSAYRTPEHNRSVGGSPRSQHVLAKAADVRPPSGMTAEQLWEHFAFAIERGEIQDGGLGLYDTFVHYDVGPAGRRWDYRSGS